MQSRLWPQTKDLAGAWVLWGTQQEGQGVLRKVGSSGSANLEMAFPGLLLSQTQRAFPVLLQTRRTEQDVLPRSTAKRMNIANEQCVLFLNSPQAVDSPPENKSLEKHPKRDQPGQADLLRWHRSRAKVSEEGRAGSAALQAPRAAMLPLLPAAHPGAWRARQTVLLLLGSSAGCGGDKREALTSGLSPPTCG